MKYGIISDVHSNLPALESVIEELNKQKVNKILCLGDIVGYGASPNECCELVRKICDVTVIGNHDSGAIGLTPLFTFSKSTQEACVWTTQNLSQENTEWFKSLPFSCKVDDFIIAHSAPSNPEKWKYIVHISDALEEFASNTFHDICFIGHSHLPVTFSLNGERQNIIWIPEFTLESEHRYLINPGSVGQPRDRDSNASFALFDTESRKVEIIRVPYDIEKAQSQIIKAGLPKSLASRLTQGR